jgi:hypothetical protein
MDTVAIRFLLPKGPSGSSGGPDAGTVVAVCLWKVQRERRSLEPFESKCETAILGGQAKMQRFDSLF